MNLYSGLVIVCGVLLATSVSCKKNAINSVPDIYGHGGISLSPERAVYPDNTEKAIFYALDILGADGVEVDVQLTTDNVLVLFHNSFLDKKTEVYEDGEKCINSATWNELEEVNKNRKHPIVRLSEMIGPILERNKLLQLDLKHYNYCTDSFVNFEMFNTALNESLAELSVAERKKVTINSRNIDLLLELDDTLIQKSFETEDIPLGITYHELGYIHKITTKLSVFSASKANKLKSAGVPFGLYQIKSKADIKSAAAFDPNETITDNIAGSKKYYR